MVKKYTIEEDVITYDGRLHLLNDDKSIALLGCSYPAIKELGIEKETELKITIKKKSL